MPLNKIKQIVRTKTNSIEGLLIANQKNYLQTAEIWGSNLFYDSWLYGVKRSDLEEIFLVVQRYLVKLRA